MKKILIIIAVIILIEIVIIVFSNLNKSGVPVNGPLITPTPVLDTTNISITPSPIITPDIPVNDNYHMTTQEKQLQNQRSFVSDLITHLPYSGKYFALAYDFNNATFVLALAKNNLVKANVEFDAYLKTNNINNRSLFENLVTSYK
jgi:hypothetical protein